MNFFRQLANCFSCCFKQPIDDTTERISPPEPQPLPSVSAEDIIPLPDKALPDEALPDRSPETPGLPTVTYLKDFGLKIINEDDIKKGAYGSVHFIPPESRHRPSEAPSDQQLALKIIKLTCSYYDEPPNWIQIRISGFQKEVKVYECIKEAGGHPNIVDFYGAFVFGYNQEEGRYESRPFDSSSEDLLAPTLSFTPYFGGIWLECCTQDLKSWKQVRFLQEAQTLQIFKQIGRPIRFLHGLKIIHNDIKEANIGVLILPDETIILKLLDFGCARDEVEDPKLFKKEEDRFANMLLDLTWTFEEFQDRSPELKRQLLLITEGQVNLAAALQKLDK